MTNIFKIGNESLKRKQNKFYAMTETETICYLPLLKEGFEK